MDDNDQKNLSQFTKHIFIAQEISYKVLPIEYYAKFYFEEKEFKKASGS